MRAYLSTLPDVNAADLREFPEPVWSYERRTEWSGPANPNHKRGSFTRLRHKIEVKVDREERWLQSFLDGRVDARLDPIVGAVRAAIRGATVDGWGLHAPSWIEKATELLRRALALAPADWWAVRAPAKGQAAPKRRSPWWVPRRSWSVGWMFIRAMVALRRYVWAIHAGVVRNAMARRQASRDAERDSSSDLRSDHPVPHEKKREQEPRTASGETAEALAAVLARIGAKVGQACPPTAM